jgi:hypothetical protein
VVEGKIFGEGNISDTSQRIDTFDTVYEDLTVVVLWYIACIEFHERLHRGTDYDHNSTYNSAGNPTLAPERQSGFALRGLFVRLPITAA